MGELTSGRSPLTPGVIVLHWTARGPETPESESNYRMREH